MGMSGTADRVRDSARADEAALLARVRAGDRVAYEELIRLHGPRMLSVARRFLHEDADARDALQDAFVSVCRSVKGFLGDSRLSTWLHRVVVNAALMRLRSQRRHPEIPLEDLGDDVWEPTATSLGRAGQESTEDALSRRQVRAEVRAAIERLPADYRTVVLLRDIAGVEVPAVAELLEIGPGSAKMRLIRGRRALRCMLGEVVGDGRSQRTRGASVDARPDAPRDGAA